MGARTRSTKPVAWIVRCGVAALVAAWSIAAWSATRAAWRSRQYRTWPAWGIAFVAHWRQAAMAATLMLLAAVPAEAAVKPFSQPVSQQRTLDEILSGPDAYRLVDWNRDSTLDLVYIKTSATGSGRTEVHVFDGRTGYREALLHAVTALGQITSTGFHAFELVDWNRDGVPDLVLVLRGATGTGTTEIHVLDGRSQFSEWLLHTGTAIADDHGEFSYKFADWNADGWIDAFAIKRSGTGSTEIHILDGRGYFQRFLLQTGTPLHETSSEFDFSIADLTATGATDGKPDLVAIKKWNSAGTVEVHTLSGRYDFQRWVIQTESAVRAVEGDDTSYAMVDRAPSDNRPRLSIVHGGSFAAGIYQPGAVEIVSWPAGTSAAPTPAGTYFTVVNCNSDMALAEVRRPGRSQSWQLMPGDHIGATFFVANGQTVELWSYLWYGLPATWHGGFDRFLVGSSAQSATIALGIC